MKTIRNINDITRVSVCDSVYVPLKSSVHDSLGEFIIWCSVKSSVWSSVGESVWVPVWSSARDFIDKHQKS